MAPPRPQGKACKWDQDPGVGRQLLGTDVGALCAGLCTPPEGQARGSRLGTSGILWSLHDGHKCSGHLPEATRRIRPTRLWEGGWIPSDTANFCTPASIYSLQRLYQAGLTPFQWLGSCLKRDWISCLGDSSTDGLHDHSSTLWEGGERAIKQSCQLLAIFLPYLHTLLTNISNAV